MKSQILEYIICPRCRADDFNVVAFEELAASNDVLNGLLVCKDCQSPYPIYNGILILLSDSDRARSTDEAFISRFSKSAKFFRAAKITYTEKPSKIHQVQEFWDDHICMGTWTEEFRQFVETRQHRFRIYPWLKDFHAFGCYSSSKLLEIGCGQGIDLCEHALCSGDRFFALGSDLSFKSLCLAKRRSEYFHVSDKIDFIVVNALNLPFKKEIFDLTYAYGSLHHSPGTLDSLNSAYETVKQHGDFKFMVYAIGSLNHLFHITLRTLEKTIKISRLLRLLPVGKGIGSMTSFKNTGSSAIIHAPYANHYFGITMKKIFEDLFEKVEIKRRTILPIAKLSSALQKIPLYNAAEKVLGYQLHCAFFNKVR